jgi:hypothetical protein
MISVPLSAIPLGEDTRFDPTINYAVKYKESKLFNFSHIMIRNNSSDGTVHLISEIRDENGLIRPNSTLDIKPE